MPTLLCASMKNVLTSSCKVASYYKSQLSSDAQCVVEFDRCLMENVICVRSDVNSEPILRLPRDNRPLSALNIKHSFVVLQTQLADLEHFAIHLWLRQSAMQSVKLILSTSVKAAQRERLIDGTIQLKLPLIVPRKRWIQIIFHLPGILEHLFTESPIIAIDAVHIAGHARLRSLMTSNDEQSCIDSTPSGFALFAVPAYTAPVWITAHCTTTSRGNNYSTTNNNNSNNNNNLSHATPSTSANMTIEKEYFIDKDQDKCLVDDTHNGSLHVNFNEQPANERYGKTNSLEKGNNDHSSKKPTCSRKADKSEPESITVECKKHTEEASSSSSSSSSMLSSLTPSCLPPLKRANKNEQMTPKKQKSSLTHTDKTYSSFEELHLSEETNTLSPSNSSKSESVIETRQWQSNECTNSESGAGSEQNNTTRSTLIKLEPIPTSSSSSGSVTSAENYTRDKNVTSTNANIIKSSVPSSSKSSTYDNNKDHLQTRATTEPIINCKNTHTSLTHNTKRKINDTYIRLLDCTKICNCNVKENINVNTSNNGNGRSVSGDVDRRKRTKDKEIIANKYDCFCAWHASLQRNHIINGEKAEQEPFPLTNSNNIKNKKSNKNNRGKDDDIASANKLSTESTSVGKTRTKSTKETCTTILEEEQHKFITLCNEREKTVNIFTSANNTATIAATNTVNINNNNHTSIVDNARLQATNVLVISNTGWKRNVENDTCKSNVTNEQPLEVTTTLCRQQEQSHEENTQSKRQQKHRCTYDTERRCEEKEQLRKKKMTRLGRQLKLLRVNAKRRQQEYVQTVNCNGRASNIPVSQVLRELCEQETHNRQIKLKYRNNDTEDDCNVYMFGFGVGYLGVLSENGEYQLDNSFEDNDSIAYSKDLLLSDLHLVSIDDNCNE